MALGILRYNKIPMCFAIMAIIALFRFYDYKQVRQQLYGSHHNVPMNLRSLSL